MCPTEGMPGAKPQPPDDDVPEDLSPSSQPARPSYVGGDFVGGNKTLTQVAGGDIVGRDKITTTSGTPSAGPSLAEHFARIERLIAARPPDPNVEKDEIKDALQRIQGEAVKGDSASVAKLERWLLQLGAMAGDVFQVTVAVLTNSTLGPANSVQQIARKAQVEQQRRDARQAGRDT